jgi:two-component system, NtrC family, sensor kinase
MSPLTMTELAESILQALPNPVFVKDDRHRFVLLNDALLNLVGHTREQMLGKSDFDFFPAALASAFWSRDDLVFATGAVDENEETLTDASGRAHSVLTRKTLHTDKSGRRFLVGAITDITERKRARERLHVEIAERQKIEIELVRAQKLEAVGRLAAGIAHEINTPIQFVSDSVDFVREAFQGIESMHRVYGRMREALGDHPILREYEEARQEIGVDYLEAQVPKALDRALEGLERVATIVRAMKDFAHPDDREKTPADLNAALSSTITIARNEYKYVADVATDFGVLPDVPCHIGELNQVFLNLIVNAAQAIEGAKRPEQRGHIRITTRLEGTEAHIAVADDGPGIPDGVRDRIFDPFFTTKPVGKGTGQGLSIARNVVVDKHGGSLTFETTLGVGTTFHVRIPTSPGAKVKGAGAPREAAVRA